MSIGNVYREDLKRLTKEVFDMECYIINAMDERQTAGGHALRAPADWKADTKTRCAGICSVHVFGVILSPKIMMCPLRESTCFFVEERDACW